MNYASYFEITLALSVTSLALGYIIGHLGLSTIRTDLENVKKAILNVQASTLSANPVSTTVTTQPLVQGQVVVPVL